MTVALTLAVALLGASPVPATVLQAISKKVPAHLRYAPARVPVGYRYTRWNGNRSGLTVSFAAAGRPPTLGFHAFAARTGAACTAGGSHTYRFGSTRVFFERDRLGDQYWRCVSGGSVSIEATASHADGSTAARRRAIAAMVASARRFG